MLFPEDNSFADRVKVVNKYRVKSQYIDIMRGSPLGNPFTLQDRTRLTAICDFEDHLDRALKDSSSEVRKEMERLLRLLLDGETVRLGCCCKPKPCHGDVIRKRLIREAKRRSRRNRG